MSSDSPSPPMSATGFGPSEPSADDHADRTSASHADESVIVDIPDDEPVGQPPESLGRRLLEPRTLISFGFALLIIVFLVTQLHIDPQEVWSHVRQANVGLLLAAGAVYYLSLFIRSLRWKSMLGRVDIDKAHGFNVPGPLGMYQIILLSWFANCVVPARLGDAFRSYLIKQRTNASFGRSLGTILAERLIDLVTLIMVLLAAGAIVFGTKVPHRAEQAFLFGAAIVFLGVVGVIVLWLGRDRFEQWLPDRLTHHYQRLHDGIFRILRRPLPYGLIGAVLWVGEGLRVLLVAWSLNQHLTIAEATLVALLSALVTAIPVTPAGLGVVEVFMIWLLGQVGVANDAAAAIALLDRFVTYFSLIMIGIPLYLLSLRKVLPVFATSSDAPHRPPETAVGD